MTGRTWFHPINSSKNRADLENPTQQRLFTTNYEASRGKHHSEICIRNFRIEYVKIQCDRVRKITDDVSSVSESCSISLAINEYVKKNRKL